MNYKDIKSRKAVIHAINECRRIGREAFLKNRQFEPSRKYILRFEGREFDSKPILAVAHRYMFPDEGELPNTFAGGKEHAAKHLARLGFQVDNVVLGSRDWSLEEVNLVVEDYFDLYSRLLAGERVNKSARIAALARRLPRRNEGAVGRKQGNISAILNRLDLPHAPGVSPDQNAQLLLEAVVIDWLDDHPQFFDAPLSAGANTTENSWVIEVAPPSNQKLSVVRAARRGVRVNFAERDERNRALGEAGEIWAENYLRDELRGAGRTDLAAAVERVSVTEGDGLGYDIASFTATGEPLFIEVKTTTGGVASPFILTPNEIGASRALERYILFRIFNFGGRPQFYRLEGSLEATCQLEPNLFKALPQ